MNNLSFEEIVKNYNNRIQMVISKFLPTDSSEDVQQEVYIKTWKNLHKYNPKYSMWTWINTITVNTCKDFIKSNKKHTCNSNIDDHSNSIEDKTISIEKYKEQKDRQKTILNAINKLKPKFKEIIILYDMEELSYEEISKKFNCPIGTVKSRLFNARKILKNELKELLKEDL